MYGLYFDGNLGGAVVYVEPSTRQFMTGYPRKVVQLNRGACTFWSPKNSASYLISRSLKMLKSEGVLLVVAYCTQEAGEIGTIYQSLGWWCVGKTLPSKAYWLDNHWVSARTLADKTKWAKDKSVEWQNKFKNLKSRKLKGKWKYIKLLGSHKQNEQICDRFSYRPLLYPKRADEVIKENGK